MLTAWRLRTYPLALAAALVVGVALFVAGAHGVRSGSGRVGGDLPAFYGAGSLVLQGRAAELYDLAAQRQIQGPLLPDAPGAIVPFAYPPAVAALYAPLAAMPFVPAYVAHCGLMLAALALATARAGRVLPRVGRWLWPAAAVALLFYPMARAVFGGQNTALSLLCAAGAYAAGGSVRRGLWLGLWLFKPQLALPVLAAVAVRDPAVLLGAAPVAAAWWAASAAVAGPGWLWPWASQVAPAFVALDRTLNPGLSISLVDVAARFLGDRAADAAWLVGQAALLGVGWKRPAVAIPVVAALAPVVAPHALFYDAGLALLGLWVAADRLGRPGLGTTFAVWVAGLLALVPGPWAALACLGSAGLAGQPTPQPNRPS